MAKNSKYLLPPEAGHISPEESRSLRNLIGFYSEEMLNTAIDGEITTVSNMRNQMIKDFDCTNPSEMMLIDTIIADYVFATELQEEINQWRGDSYSDSRIKIINMLGKQLDMTRRRLQSEYQTLIALKKPAINVNIKAKNAVIGQNQQFNANTPRDTQ